MTMKDRVFEAAKQAAGDRAKKAAEGFVHSAMERGIAGVSRWLSSRSASGGASVAAGAAGAAVAAGASGAARSMAGQVFRSTLRVGAVAQAAAFVVDQAADMYRYKRGYIDRPELYRRSTTNVGTAAGNLGGTALGASLGTLLLPGIGTAVGAAGGAWLGARLGERGGRSLGH